MIFFWILTWEGLKVFTAKMKIILQKLFSLETLQYIMYNKSCLVICVEWRPQPKKWFWHDGQRFSMRTSEGMFYIFLAVWVWWHVHLSYNSLWITINNCRGGSAQAELPDPSLQKTCSMCVKCLFCSHTTVPFKGSNHSNYNLNKSPEQKCEFWCWSTATMLLVKRCIIIVLAWTEGTHPHQWFDILLKTKQKNRFSLGAGRVQFCFNLRSSPMSIKSTTLAMGVNTVKIDSYWFSSSCWWPIDVFKVWC